MKLLPATLLTVALALNVGVAVTLFVVISQDRSCQVEKKIVQLPRPTPEEWKARVDSLALAAAFQRDEMAWAVVRGLEMYRRGQFVRPLD